MAFGIVAVELAAAAAGVADFVAAAVAAYFRKELVLDFYSVQGQRAPIIVHIRVFPNVANSCRFQTNFYWTLGVSNFLGEFPQTAAFGGTPEE